MKNDLPPALYFENLETGIYSAWPSIHTLIIHLHEHCTNQYIWFSAECWSVFLYWDSLYIALRLPNSCRDQVNTSAPFSSTKLGSKSCTPDEKLFFNAQFFYQIPLKASQLS